MFDGFPGAGVERAGTSVPNYLDRLAIEGRLRFGGALSGRRVPVGQGASAEGVAAMNVSPSFFRVLARGSGSRPVLHGSGRHTGRDKVVVLEPCIRATASRRDRWRRRPRAAPERRALPRGRRPPESSPSSAPRSGFSSPLPSPTEKRKNSATARTTNRRAPQARARHSNRRKRGRRVERRAIERAGPLKAALMNARYHTVVGSPTPTSCATCAAPCSCCGVACCSCCSSPRSTSPISRWCVPADG